MKNLSGLTKEEQELEKIVEKIKFSSTVQGIGILKDFWNEAIEIAAENAETKEIGDKYGEWLMDDVDKDSILKLKK